LNIKKEQMDFQVEKRSGLDRRNFFYTGYIPERREGKDRRINVAKQKKTTQ